jgi:antitoxin HicB
MYAYPVELQPEGGGYVVTFPDLPYGITEGDDLDEALAHAVPALETVLIGLMGDKQDIPAPSPAAGRPTVSLPAMSCVKVALYQTMREEGVRKAELARRLGLHMPQIDRLLDLRHTSRIDQLEAALQTLGRRLVLDLQDAA